MAECCPDIQMKASFLLGKLLPSLIEVSNATPYQMSYSVPHEESRKLIFEVFVNLVCHGTC